jgi:hypothetical protein
MANQSGNNSGGGGGRAPYAKPPGLAELIDREERRLGISDENSALSPDQQDDVLDKAYERVAVPVGQAVKDAKDVRWIVRNMLARGGLYIIAGNPKKAKKSLLCLELCLQVSRGKPFLGLGTAKLKAIFANFEDGYERMARRLRDFGVSPDALDDVDIVAQRGGFATLLVYIKWRKPPFVVLDPTIEIERLMGVQDENKSDQIADMLGDLRELGRTTDTTILMPHHLTRATQMIRGSGAFEGSIDGYIYVRQQKDGSMALEITNRDSEDVKIPFAVTFIDGRTRITTTGPPVVGPLSEFSMKKNASASTDKGAAKFSGPTDDVARDALLRALLNSTDGLGRDDRRAAAGVRVDRLAKIQSELIQEGLVVQKGRKMVLTPKGAEGLQKREPKPIDDLIGGNEAVAPSEPEESGPQDETADE